MLVLGGHEAAGCRRKHRLGRYRAKSFCGNFADSLLCFDGVGSLAELASASFVLAARPLAYVEYSLWSLIALPSVSVARLLVSVAHLLQALFLVSPVVAFCGWRLCSGDCVTGVLGAGFEWANG